MNNHFWWQGASGVWYIHTIYPFANALLQHANYIFVRSDAYGRKFALYIGETDDFSSRFACHEKIGAARNMGANEIHVHLLAEERGLRLNIETDLRRGHAPPLNEQGGLATLMSSNLRGW